MFSMRTTETSDLPARKVIFGEDLAFCRGSFLLICFARHRPGNPAGPGSGYFCDASWIRLRRSWSRLHEVADEQRRLVECLLAGRTATNPKEELLRIPKFALDILVCPLCKTRVELLADESGLKCVSCRRVYPIRDDIPVMLPEEATIAEENRNT